MVFFLAVSSSFSDQSYVDQVMVLLIPENLGQRRTPQAAVKRSLKMLDRMFQMNDVISMSVHFKINWVRLLLSLLH